VTLKVALAALAAIDTVAGTVTPVVELKAIVVCVATGLVIVAVQTATAPGAREAGGHESPLRLGVTIRLAVPPVAVIVIGLPSSAAAIAPEIPTATEFAVGAGVMDTVATMPFETRLVLTPVAMHV
jgi:hypothetical protein